MFRPTWPTAMRTDDISLVWGGDGWRAVQRCKCHIAHTTVTNNQLDLWLQWTKWQCVGQICRTGLVRVAWSTPLFDLLVSTSWGARESATSASLDSTGRRERWGRYSECLRLDIPQIGVPLLPGKIYFVHPWCLHQLLDSPSLLSNEYRGPLPDVDRGRRECDDPSLSTTEVGIAWSCSFLAWGFFKAPIQSCRLPLPVERLQKMLHNARNTHAVFYCKASGKV